MKTLSENAIKSVFPFFTDISMYVEDAPKEGAG
jgi:hypothetical protein